MLKCIWMEILHPDRFWRPESFSGKKRTREPDHLSLTTQAPKKSHNPVLGYNRRTRYVVLPRAVLAEYIILKNIHSRWKLVWSNESISLFPTRKSILRFQAPATFFTAPPVSSRCTSLEDRLLAREASACVVY